MNWTNNNNNNGNTQQKVYSHVHNGHPLSLSQGFRCHKILKYKNTWCSREVNHNILLTTHKIINLDTASCK